MTLVIRCDLCGATEPLADGDRRPEGWVRELVGRGLRTRAAHRCTACVGREGAQEAVSRPARVGTGQGKGEAGDGQQGALW